jgi:hypothetical protein
VRIRDPGQSAAQRAALYAELGELFSGIEDSSGDDRDTVPPERPVPAPRDEPMDVDELTPSKKAKGTGKPRVQGEA